MVVQNFNALAGVESGTCTALSDHYIWLQDLNQIVSLVLFCQQSHQGLDTSEGVLECSESRWDVVRCKSTKVMHQNCLPVICSVTHTSFISARDIEINNHKVLLDWVCS